VQLYPKIMSLMKRVTEGPDKGRFIMGEWATPELEYLAGNQWSWTEKVDGTNCRVGYNTGLTSNSPLVDVNGRTDNAQLHSDLLKILFGVGDVLKDWRIASDDSDTPWTLFGEGYGAGIQSGGHYCADKKFILFDVLVGEWWLKREDVVGVAENLGLDVVPDMGTGTLYEAINVVQGDDFKSKMGPDARPEGLVCKPVVPLADRRGNLLITKVKTVDFK
jgi:hypothetical protein